ncbi:MAG: hypothetical protein ACI9HK_004419, partial [Pirellulaceae bacterium]
MNNILSRLPFSAARVGDAKVVKNPHVPMNVIIVAS